MLYRQAEQWSTRPSEILRVTDWMAAYSIDQAVWNFGTALQAALDKAEDEGKNKNQKRRKREQVLKKWLPGGQADTKAYRDPARSSPEGGIRNAAG